MHIFIFYIVLYIILYMYYMLCIIYYILYDLLYFKCLLYIYMVYMLTTGAIIQFFSLQAFVLSLTTCPVLAKPLAGNPESCSNRLRRSAGRWIFQVFQAKSWWLKLETLERMGCLPPIRPAQDFATIHSIYKDFTKIIGWCVSFWHH